MTGSSLNESRDWTGEWWLPDDPEKKVPGVLSYSPENGLRLRLIGGWDYHVTRPGRNGSTIVTDSVRLWPMVLGTGDGEAITLLSVSVVTARSFGFGSLFGPPDKLELRASTALVGVYMEAPNEWAFTAASANVEDLTVWSRRSGIEETQHWASGPDTVSGEIQLTRLSPLAVEVGPLTVKLSHYSWPPYSERSRAETLTHVRESQVIRFERSEAQPLGYWIDLLDGVADLMSLSTLRPCGIISMRVYFPSKPDDWPEGHPMQRRPHEVTVYKVRVVDPKPNDQAINLSDYVLTLDDLPFEELMPRWLEVRDTFAAARSMILGLRYVRGGYIETQVVTAVAAAESMHRALDPAPPIPADEFTEIRKTLLQAVSPERKGWLADRLNERSNVPTLKQRLLELVERLGEAGQRLVHETDVWAKAAKDARNNLAHVGTTEKDLKHLHAVAEVTAGVVILNLLHELGVPQHRLQKAIDKNPALSYAARLAREVLCGDYSTVMQIAAINVGLADDKEVAPAADVRGIDVVVEPAPTDPFDAD